MDKHMIERDEYTGIAELNKLIDFFNKNDYEYIREGCTKLNKNLNANSNTNTLLADFIKEISFTNKEGSWVDEKYIKISIEFNNEFNIHLEKNGFVSKLIERRKEMKSLFKDEI